MITPRIEINLEKIAHNAKALINLYGAKGIDVIGVTKWFVETHLSQKHW
jgi:predicted amino acid racemase